MTLVLTIVAPIFGIILLGLLAGRLRYLSEGAETAIVEFVFRIAIPALMFKMLATAPAIEGDPVALYGVFFGAVAVVWIAATVLGVGVLRQPAGDGASIAFASIFGNLVLLGLPIALKSLGPEAATPIAIVLLLEFPLLWLAATLHLALVERQGTASLGSALWRQTVGLIKNPIVAALIAGAAWRATGLGMHPIPDRVLELFGNATAPASLFALGMALARLEVGGRHGVVALIVGLKLAVMPAVAWWLAFHVLALPPLWAGTIVLLAAMPPGTIPYLFATENDRASGSVAAAVAIGTALSAPTIAVMLYLLGTVGGLRLASG